MEPAGAVSPIISAAAPAATYRLQLSPGFGFADAAELAGYLAALGVSHAYLSPILQAAPGSTHGYDVIDHSHLSEELGGADAYHALCAALRSAGLGQVVDVVPNHMAAVPENRWWWDVLENGPLSVEAGTFDIDWTGDGRGGDQRSRPILAPVLGDHYGRIVDRGELVLARRGGRFEVHYHEHRFPLAPRTLDTLLHAAAARLAEPAARDRLRFFADAFGALPASWRTDTAAVSRRHRDKEVLAELLAAAFDAEVALAAAVDEELRAASRDPVALDALLDRQNYRLAHWRSGAYELDYRRFFDITTLVGLRVDHPDVFERTHGLLLSLVEEGCIDGLRIDHPDGLRDPGRYVERLAQRAAGRWIVAEKILARGETLPDWPLAGTTGYEFATLAGGLLLDPAGEAPLTELHHQLSGDERSWPEHELEAKRYVLRRMLAADLSRLVGLFLQVCDAERAWRDYPTEILRRGLEEALISFPVYRTYVQSGGPGAPPVCSERDAAIIAASLARAGAAAPDVPGELFRFLGEVLLLRRGGEAGAELAARFQQLTAPVTAKGIEDTAGYRYSRLGPLSEVGGDPGAFAVPVEEFHEHNRRVAERWPTTMLATSTHDTKRSEDVRARLSLLSERAEEWAATLWRWRQREVPYRSAAVDGWAEKFLYELLVGAHPLPAERAWTVMVKAVREAKLATSWLDPDPDYEAAIEAFVAGAVADEVLAAELAAFVEPMIIPGRMASLALLVLKLASPGVPDLYQGTELWDTSLVDPDNRRPVDFELRRAALERCAALAPLDGSVDDAVLDLADESGLAKLHTIRASLAARRRFPNAFGPAGSYRPLRAEGPAASHAVAFARGDDIIAVVPRLTWRLTRPGGGWAGTVVPVAGGATGGRGGMGGMAGTARWRNAYTGDRFEGDVLALDDVLRRFPVALLIREPR